jgi:surfactin synthase thioesterase subunit
MTEPTIGAVTSPRAAADSSGRAPRRKKQSPWTAVVRPVLGIPLGRVVAAPHSGSGPNALSPLLRQLPDTLEVVGVTLPGRERRLSESLDALADPATVVNTITGELLAADRLPTVLFGHSMGAALATAVALAAPQLCQGLVLSAYPAPSTPTGRDELSEEALLDLVRVGGGTPEEMLEDPSLRSFVVSRLRSDVALGRSLIAGNAGRRLPVTPAVLNGRDDALAPPVTVDPWSSPEPARRRVFPGGHFYLLDDENRGAVAAEIAAAAVSGRPGSP